MAIAPDFVLRCFHEKSVGGKYKILFSYAWEGEEDKPIEDVELRQALAAAAYTAFRVNDEARFFDNDEDLDGGRIGTATVKIVPEVDGGLTSYLRTSGLDQTNAVDEQRFINFVMAYYERLKLDRGYTNPSPVIDFGNSMSVAGWLLVVFGIVVLGIMLLATADTLLPTLIK